MLAYARGHTIRECWEKHPVTMSRMHRSVAVMKAALVPLQKETPHVYVKWGPTNTGKSHMCHVGASGGAGADYGERDYYVMCTPTKGAVTWYDDYTGQEDVVIEDLSGEIGYRLLLRMLDKYRMRVQIKGAMVSFCPKRVWISSNKHPKEWFDPVAVGPYEGGPLERRLEIDPTGHLEHVTTVYKE